MKASVATEMSDKALDTSMDPVYEQIKIAAEKGEKEVRYGEQLNLLQVNRLRELGYTISLNILSTKIKWN